MVEFINTPPQYEFDIFELKSEVLPEIQERHGLSAEVYLLSNQVTATMSDANHISIQARDIQVVGYNPVAQQIHFNTVRVRNYRQSWDFGGSYLRPEKIDEPLY